MALKARVVHNVFDGVVADAGRSYHAEQAHAALADEGELVDLHVNHLPVEKGARVWGA